MSPLSLAPASSYAFSISECLFTNSIPCHHVASTRRNFLHFLAEAAEKWFVFPNRIIGKAPRSEALTQTNIGAAEGGRGEQ